MREGKKYEEHKEIKEGKERSEQRTFISSVSKHGHNPINEAFRENPVKAKILESIGELNTLFNQLDKKREMQNRMNAIKALAESGEVSLSAEELRYLIFIAPKPLQGRLEQILRSPTAASQPQPPMAPPPRLKKS